MKKRILGIIKDEHAKGVVPGGIDQAWFEVKAATRSAYPDARNIRIERAAGRWWVIGERKEVARASPALLFPPLAFADD